MTRVWVALGLIGVLGCGGGDDKPQFHVGPTDDEKRDASVEEEVPGDAGVAKLPQNGPILEFTTPEAVDSPTDDNVITTRDVTVRCRARERSKAGIDRSSVKISLVKNASGPTMMAGATNQLPDDEWEAKFDVGTQPNGLLRFRCEAKDTTAKAGTTIIELDTLLDLGPTIEVFDPKDDGVYALNSAVVIQFKVTAAPLKEDDSEAEVASMKVQVSGVEFPLAAIEDKPGTYQTSVNFNDRNRFKVPPTTAEVLITATNGRSPAATRTAKLNIGIDGDGPSIKVESPKFNSISRGEVELRVSVTDPAGVAPRSLKAEINGDLLVITDWEVMGSVYTQKFDTRKFDRELVQITISLTAADVVGNESMGVSHILNLDNLPPVVSLDPPNIREWKNVGDSTYCGEEFDPVGEDAISDLDTAVDLSLYRVFVEDRTIFAPGANIAYYAGVNRTSVTLYAQPDTNIPLLYDTNGDGNCDEINFLDLPSGQRPTPLTLGPANPRGASWFPKPADVNFSTATHMAPGCVADPAGAVNPPNSLCPGSPRRIVAGRGADKPPAVYGLTPTNGSGAACEGMTWQVLPIVGEGWACLAARAEDNIGNIGVSEAIRVCFDKDPNDGNLCTGAPPNCNKNNCKITDAQRFEANTVWQVR
ncbi:MAG TPA: hypothetical protein VJV78_21660 [Polyangiales bacterium]|nr:hypothetical protein [Polyangiales bacterium]